MMLMGETFMDKLPFDHIYLHALVRDEHGQKMSKSKGNVIDPLDMVEKYSADALRFTLAVLAVQGRDIRLSEDKLELSRNFTNKLYNAAKFLQMNVETFEDLENIDVTTDLGRYMLSRFNAAVEETRGFLDEYRFNDAATVLYRFLWNEFCDWGIELSKVSKESVPELGAIFKASMKLLHPFMPFMTEYLYHELSGTSLETGDSIMVSRYPVTGERDMEIEAMFDVVMDAIVTVRRAKTLIDMGNQRIDEAYVKTDAATSEAMEAYICRLGKVKNVGFVAEKMENAVSDIGEQVEVFIPTGSIDLAPIIDRLNKQNAKLEKEIAKLAGMLNNERFVANAPEEVVAQNREALVDAQNKQRKILDQLESLQGA
jgi:valyl-tRNA synthetase